MRLHLTFFGDSRFNPGKKRLRKSAALFGCFDSVIEFDDNALKAAPFWSQHAQAVFVPRNKNNKHGSYISYYMAKPYIVLHALERLPDNDVLLYLDAGCELNPQGLQKFNSYVAASEKNGALFFRCPVPLIKWTKMDTYRRICGADDSHFFSRMPIAGVFFLKKTQAAIALVKEWLSICIEARGKYLADTPSVAPNHVTFSHHVHDQAILASILLRDQPHNAFVFSDDFLLAQPFAKEAERLKISDRSAAAQLWHENAAEYPIWIVRTGRFEKGFLDYSTERID